LWAVLLATAGEVFCASADTSSDNQDAAPSFEAAAIETLPAGLPEFNKSAADAPKKSQTQPAEPPSIKPATPKNITPAQATNKAEKTLSPSSASSAARPADESGTEEEKLQNIILKLQLENSRLMAALNKGHQVNANLTNALRESRMHASDMEAEIRRKEIELTVKNEEAVLERLKTVATTQPAKTAQILQQENNILSLQLKLYRIDEPQRTKEMLEKIGDITRERDTLADKNKRIHTMLNEQIKKNEQTGEELKVIRNNFQSSEKEIARLQLEIKAYKEAMANPAAASRVEYVTRKPVTTSPAANKTSSADDESQSASDDEEESSNNNPVKIEINRIAGKITSIDDQIIKINVGSLHGLQAGMRLIVYRRDKFVGYLRIDIVGDTTAAGAMSRQVFPPQIGDNVVDRL